MKDNIGIILSAQAFARNWGECNHKDVAEYMEGDRNCIKELLVIEGEAINCALRELSERTSESIYDQFAILTAAAVVLECGSEDERIDRRCRAKLLDARNAMNEFACVIVNAAVHQKVSEVIEPRFREYMKDS